MGRRLLLSASMIVVWMMAYGLAAAHPHSEVDQQALLSVGMDSVTLTIRIVPSYIEGTTIFGLIDVDGNGVVTDDEAAAFGNDVIAAAALSVDGERFAFAKPKTAVPEFEHVASGFGIIEIEAGASYVLERGGKHQLVFSIAYEAFSPDWLIQPFFYMDFLDATSSRAVERPGSGKRIEIDFRSTMPESGKIEPE